MVFNGIFQVLNAALDGFGLAFIPETIAEPHIKTGRMRRVLEDWFPYWEGYHHTIRRAGNRRRRLR